MNLGSVIFILAFLIGLIFNPRTAFAQQNLGWKDLLTAAKENSLQIKTQSFLTEGSEADHKRAWGGVLPKIDLEGKKTTAEKKTGANNVSGITLPSTSQDIKIEDTQAKLTLPLFRGFATLADIRKTEAEYQKSLQDKKLSEISLRHELRKVVTSYLLAIERQKVYLRLLERQKLNVDLLKLKYNSGSEARWGHKQARADLQFYEWRVEEQRKQESLSFLQLVVLTGIEPNSLRLKITLAELSKVDASENLPRHPEIRIRELGIQSAAEDVVTAKSQLFPQVDAFYGIQNVKPSVGAETSERIYGIGLRWNIFAGFSDYNQISQARALKMAKEAELEFEKRKLELEFKESKEKLSLMQEKLPILEGSLEAARERAKTVNEQYKAGLRSYLDWEQSQSKLIRSEEDLLEGKNSLLLAIADYEKQQGLGL